MRRVPERRRTMKTPALLFLLGTVLSLSLFSQNQVRRDASFEELAIPAWSTTGPVPPRGVDIAGRRFHRFRVQAADVIPGVPAYLWRHGSGPTAVGMVLAYYDTHGFPDLLPGDASVQTDAVNLALASVGHYNDYCLPLDSAPNILKDKSEPPEGDEHVSDSLADFMKTSWSVNEAFYGWTWSIDVKPGYESYVKLVSSYIPLMSYSHSGNIVFQTIRNEIESRRPLVLLVDTDGDAITDHFVTVVGVLTESGTDYYGCYNTWDKTVHWYPFRKMGQGIAWGVQSAYLLFLSYGLFPPSKLKVERLDNDYIFFKESINRLSWEPNPANKSDVVRYRIYRKVKGAANSTYLIHAEAGAGATSYDDRNLKATDLFTYRISSLDAAGRESSFTAAGN